MIEVAAPEEIVCGQPFEVSYTSATRVAGRLRLTRDTELVSFTLTPLGDGGPIKEPVTGTAHRVRGRSGRFSIRDWGDHPVGCELVLRFEGVKRWMRVVEG